MTDRVLKFRAWDLDNFNMFYSERQGEGDGAIVFLIDRESVHFEEMQLIDRLVGGEHEQTEEYRTPKQVVMQFTGMQDKNGKDIYEGDYVTAVTDADYLEEFNPDAPAGSYRGEVAYRDSMFVIIDGLHVVSLSAYFIKSLEIIGNIHEQEQQ